MTTDHHHHPEGVFPTQAEAEARYVAIFGTRTRFVIMVLVLFCLASIWSNILAFNFAIVCMEQSESDEANSSMLHPNDRHEFSSGEQSLAVSIVAIAALVGNFPIVTLVNKVGIRTVFAGLGILSALSTLAVPASIRMGYHVFLVIRFLQGFAFAANFPVIGSFCAKWAYFKQIGLFSSCLVAYVQLAPAITMPASGMLCSAFNWPSIFYAHGVSSLLLFLAYALFYRNSPQKHPFVGIVELSKIATGKVAVDKRAEQALPYREILSTASIWGVWIASIGNFVCVNMMFLYSPIYLSKVLGFDVHKTGLSAALPPIAQFSAKLLFGAISDRIKCISEANKFRLFNSISFLGAAGGLVVLAFMPAETRQINMLLLGVSAGFLGASTGGFFKAAPYLSKQYSHFVTGNISLGITITMLVVPFVVNALTPNNTQDEWRWVFLVTAASLVVTDVIFCVVIRGKPCAWTESNAVPAVKVAVAKTPTPDVQKY